MTVLQSFLTLKGDMKLAADMTSCMKCFLSMLKKGIHFVWLTLV